MPRNCHPDTVSSSVTNDGQLTVTAHAPKIKVISYFLWWPFLLHCITIICSRVSILPRFRGICPVLTPRRPGKLKNAPENWKMSKATRKIEWRLNYWIHLWALKLIAIWSAQKLMICLFLHQNCSKKQNHLKNTIYNVNKVFEIWKKSI